ncbi:MAG: hypothetical protein L0H84_06490 [Pseudonocardia sp.]|nr:hypothetical protein [Pseudonocardia sp.]
MDFTPAGIKAQYARSQPPKQIHQAFLAVVGIFAISLLSIIVNAIATAIFFGSYGGIGGAIVSLIVWAVLAAIGLFIAIQMRAGLQWARITLAVLAGIGALFNLLGVFGSLALIAIVGLLGFLTLLFALVSLALCVAILVLMFRPASNNAYFH